MIEFECNTCGRYFNVPDDLAGKTAQCKGCGEVLRIPHGYETKTNSEDGLAIIDFPEVDTEQWFSSNGKKEEASLISTYDETTNPSVIKAKDFGTFVAIATFVLFILSLLFCNGKKLDPAIQREESLKISAMVTAENVVKSLLKYPHDAEFNSDQKAILFREGTCATVTGTVRAKNSFGAELTQDYEVSLEWRNQRWEWESVKIGQDKVNREVLPSD